MQKAYAYDEDKNLTRLQVWSGDRLLTDNYYQYDAWGNLTGSEESVPNRFAFAGEQLDPVTKQYYLRARYYNPVIARFTQEDTYRGAGLNLYAYCQNNPVYYVDPSGHVPECQKDAYQKYRKEGMTAAEAYQKATGKNPFKTEGAKGEDKGSNLPGLSAQDRKQLEQVGKKIEVDPAENRQKAPEVEKPKDEGGSGAGDSTTKSKTYQTYTKTNPITGEVYCGRTSGIGTPAENVRQRDSHHHMNDKGFGPAVLDKSSTNYDAIRGREQMLIDFYGGAKSTGGNSGNAINGIGNQNKKKDIYLNVAKGEFGEIE